MSRFDLCPNQSSFLSFFYIYFMTMRITTLLTKYLKTMFNTHGREHTIITCKKSSFLQKKKETRRSKRQTERQTFGKKFLFFAKVNECFSRYFDLISTLAGTIPFRKATLNVPISHNSHVVGPEKTLPW